MNIALVILHADPSRGGAERYTADLAAALTREEDSVSLLATSFADVPAGVRPVMLETRGISRAAHYRSMLAELDLHLARTPYDIVHAMLPVNRCHVYHPHAGLAAEAIGKAPVKALMNPRRRAMAEVERELLTSDTQPRVLCLSQYVRAEVRRHYQLNESHLPVLFNAVDTDRFTPSSGKATSDRVVALMIAQDFERKGLKVAIEALARLNDPRLTLRVVGRPDPTKYRRLAESLGISAQVEFAGPTDDPAAEYRRADFFVLPTRHDPCSLVVLEALASGLPVISTIHNGACEIMSDGQHGFVLSSADDANALTTAMRQLMDPALRSVQSAACVALRPALSYAHHLTRLREVYQLVMLARTAPAT